MALQTNQKIGFSNNKAVVKFNKTVVIAVNGTVSTAMDMEDGTLCGVFIPAGFVGTAMTFQTSIDGITFVAVNNAAGALSYVVAASKYIAIDPKDFRGMRYIKLVSGSSETGGPLTLTAAYRVMM